MKAFASFLFAAQTAFGAFGPSFSTGPVSGGAYITQAVSTLIVPTGNTPLRGFFSLWVGMGTTAGDLIQSILDRHPGDGVAKTPCETITGDSNWCGFPYTLSRNGYQDIGTQMRVVAGDTLQFKYVYSTRTGNYTQYLSKNGGSPLTLSTSDGFAAGWGTAVECAATDCGTAPAHKWVNTTLTMNKPDPNYSQTLSQSPGVKNSGFRTTDGGLNWKVTTIYIPKFTFT